MYFFIQTCHSGILNIIQIDWEQIPTRLFLNDQFVKSKHMPAVMFSEAITTTGIIFLHYQNRTAKLMVFGHSVSNTSNALSNLILITMREKELNMFRSPLTLRASAKVKTTENNINRCRLTLPKSMAEKKSSLN